MQRKKTLNNLVAWEDAVNKVENEEELMETDKGVLEEYPVLVSAITGDVCHNTTKIKWKSRGIPLTILIDSGSTYSFLDCDMVKRLRVVTE